MSGMERLDRRDALRLLGGAGLATGVAASGANQNYLRGVQQTASDGTVTFQTIFPGCYDGRWPHMHFEIYESVKAATSGGTKLKTTQLAMPEDACTVVYAGADGYESSVANL